MRNDSGEARMTLETFDRDLLLADLGEGIVGARIIVERDGAAIGRVVVGAQPVLPHDDGIGRECCAPAR
jgi:hypothetical protein